jgi:DNA-binding response OmpR family regulator
MRTIIVVDDNEDILEITKLILEDYDYEVITLSDGNLLPGTIKEHKPDLILLDIMLGNMDGRELCKLLKLNKETSNIPIILVSASHNITDYVALGTQVDFLAKPFDINDLIGKVTNSITAAA